MIKRQSLLNLVAASAFVLVGSFGQASILFGPAARYSTVKTTDQTSFAGGTGESSVLAADAHLGILIEGTPIYIGGIYSYEATTSGSTDKMNGTNYGASVGYYQGAFSLIGTYLLGAERTYKSGNAEAKLSSGTGYRVDLAYVAGLTPSIGLGPQLTYSSMKFSKSTPSGGVESSNTYEVVRLDPSIVLWFRF